MSQEPPVLLPIPKLTREDVQRLMAEGRELRETLEVKIRAMRTFTAEQLAERIR